MPASQRSLRLTDAYRRRLVGLSDRVQAEARAAWPKIEELDGTTWPALIAARVTRAQVEGVRLSAAFVSAFLASETGRRAPVAGIAARDYAGTSRDGRSLTEALNSPIIGVRKALKEAYAKAPRSEEVTPEQALEWLRGGTHGNLQGTRVDDLARKMESGAWDPDRGRIMITRDGFVFDGQHRLQAVVQSGASVKMLVARDLSNPMRVGLNRALRMVGFEAMQTPRDALLGAIDADDRIEGFQRAVSGTCAACMALSGTSGPRFEVHPGCQCLPMPKVSGVRDRFPLPSGTVLFNALSKTEQDAKIGPEAAELVREGRADLRDFVAHSPQAEQDDFLTQRPVEALT